MDSKLVSVVKDLESESERILSEARQQATVIHTDTERSISRFAEERRAEASREAEDLLRQNRARTQADSEQSRAKHKAALDTLLHRAENRMEKAVNLILEHLGKP